MLYEVITRGGAAWALGELGDGRAREALAARGGDAAPAAVYEGEEIVTKEVGGWAREAAAKLVA